MDTKIGVQSFLREDNGEKTKIVNVPISDFMDISLNQKARLAGCPAIISREKISGRIVRTVEWIEGVDLYSIRNEWTKEMFEAWGAHIADLHNLGISVWDLFPRNVVWTGERCVFVDVQKFYESDFPEYDALKDVILNYGIERSLRDAFVLGYVSKRHFNFRKILDVLIDHVHDSYQDITLNGSLVRELSRSNLKPQFVREEDIRGLRVYDLGCSHGELSRSLARMGAGSVHGFDNRTRGRYQLIVLSRLLAFLENLDNCFFHNADVESKIFEDHYGKIKADTVFLCAVLGHIHKDRAQFIREIDQMTNKALYFETNLGGKKDASIDFLMEHTAFKNFEYLGETGDRGRGHEGYYFIRCSR